MTTTDPTATPWTDRIHARVEARQSAGAQTEILPGYVVAVYDRQAKDPDAPVHHSEWAHGDLGVFGSEVEAEEYRDRIGPATIAAREQAEHEREVRAPKAVHLGVEYQAKRDKAKAEASAANTRAKEAQKAADRLQQEAESPEILIECTPRGASWRVMAAPALIDGTLGGAPRLLQRSITRRREKLGGKGALDQALADMDAAGGPAKATRQPPKRKAKAPPAEDLPPVVDAAGAELGIGSRVDLMGLKPVAHGKIVEIGEYDHEYGSWNLVVECEDGEILRPWASECARAEGESQPEAADPE